MISQVQTDKKHITFIGRKKVGKSKLANAFIGQDSRIISSISDTASSPIKQTSKLFPYGVDIYIDAYDIEDICCDEKNEKFGILQNSDFVIVVLDGRDTLTYNEIQLFKYLEKTSIPHLVAVNKIEFGVNESLLVELKALKVVHFEISCTENVGIDSLKLKLIRMLP